MGQTKWTAGFIAKCAADCRFIYRTDGTIRPLLVCSGTGAYFRSIMCIGSVYARGYFWADDGLLDFQPALEHTGRVGRIVRHAGHIFKRGMHLSTPPAEFLCSHGAGHPV